MSRSRRRTPITGWSMAPSEKDDKRRYNRILRRLNRERLAAFGENRVLLDKREILGRWQMRKDGKMHFDPKKYPNLLRK